VATTTEDRVRLGPSATLDIRGAYSIWQRELVRFFRERSRAITSLVQPLLYLLVFGTGLGAAIRGNVVAGDYRVFLLPGVIVMTALFSSMMGGMSVMWDREFGFLKEILVAPVSRSAVIAGKASGGATTAGMQGMAILIFAPVVGMSLVWWRAVAVLPVLLLFAVCINLLGIGIASRTQTMQAFFVIQNFVMLPLFFLSGAVYPLNTVPGWLRVIAIFDPATYAVDAIRHTLIPAFPQTVLWGDTPLTIGVDVAVLAIFAAAMFVMAVRGLNKQP
jgi:ABC-2 type transport system permease protein